MLAEPCPCCSGKTYQACCAPLHQGAVAANPEALMRSRFSAHARGLLDYLLASWASAARAQVDTQELAHWLTEAEFGLLKVRAAADDWVEFECWFRQAGQLEHLHDRSFFIQEHGHWRYARSEPPQLKPTMPARNEPCPCGSGKKYKKCCG